MKRLSLGMMCVAATLTFGACDDGGGGGTDAGTDAGPSSTVLEEQAACDNLSAIDPLDRCQGGATEAACLEALAGQREAFPLCIVEHIAFVRCLQGLTECADGMQCPAEFQAFQNCAN